MLNYMTDARHQDERSVSLVRADSAVRALLCSLISSVEYTLVAVPAI